MSDSDLKLSIWDHIEDLRKMLIRCACVAFLGFLAVLCFHEKIFQLLTDHWQANNPLIEQEFKQFRVSNDSETDRKFILPQSAQVIESANTSQDEKQPGLYFIHKDGYIDYNRPADQKLLILSPIEGLLLTLKISFWLGLALTAPLWGWIIFQFILPGLHVHEKRIVIPFLAFSCFGIALGLTLAYTVTIPLANEYLQSFNSSLGQNAWSLSHYVDYTLLIYFGHVIAFEICILLLLLVHFQLISHEWLTSKRRYMIVAAFILAALLTPPDVLTQFALAIPLVGFYEMSIFYARWRKFTI